MALLTNQFSECRQQGRAEVNAPKVAGKNALVFYTDSGPHTGINKAIPADKYVGQFFEHLGFTVLDEWYIVGKFYSSKEASTIGMIGEFQGVQTNVTWETWKMARCASQAYADVLHP